MSWQAYVDSSLVGTGHIDKAAILDATGASVWATTAGFTVTPEEGKNLAAILNNTAGAQDKARAEGVHVAGARNVVLNILDRSLYARQGKVGIIAVKTKQAILVATTLRTCRPAMRRRQSRRSRTTWSKLGTKRWEWARDMLRSMQQCARRRPLFL